MYIVSVCYVDGAVGSSPEYQVDSFDTEDEAKNCVNELNKQADKNIEENPDKYACAYPFYFYHFRDN